MTDNEKALIAALEGDNQTWEFVAQFYERHITDFEVLDGKKMSGHQYARGLRQRIVDNRALIEKVKRG